LTLSCVIQGPLAGPSLIPKNEIETQLN